MQRDPSPEQNSVKRQLTMVRARVLEIIPGALEILSPLGEWSMRMQPISTCNLDSQFSHSLHALGRGGCCVLRGLVHHASDGGGTLAKDRAD